MTMLKNLIVNLFALLALWGCSLPTQVPDSEQFRLMQEKAYAGDMESQYQLGMQYTIDSRWAWDRTRGYRWFVAAAERGHPDAQYMVGMCKLLGRGTLYDKAGAVAMFRRSAEQGKERAQYQLGLAYLNGQGIVKDRPWGRHWLEQAAWNGHKEAQFLLGALFAKGVGGQKNLAEAWRWLEKARLGGQAQSALALVRLEENTSPLDKDVGKMLLAQQPRIDTDGLYSNPRVRYVQTILNRLGYQAGSEDGLSGPQTDSAVASFLLANKLPRETQIIQLVESLRGKD